MRTHGLRVVLRVVQLIGLRGACVAVSCITFQAGPKTPPERLFSETTDVAIAEAITPEMFEAWMGNMCASAISKPDSTTATTLLLNCELPPLILVK